MSNSSKRLSDIYNFIREIHLESVSLIRSNKFTLEKKLEFFQKTDLLINEAKSIISILENRIYEIREPDIDLSKITKIEYLQDLVQNSPSIEETLNILDQLEAISNKTNTLEIIEDIEKDVLYEK